MLREILSITGRPGLFKIVSQGNRMIIVENITTKARSAAHERDKIVSLGDIAMYTEGDDLPLGQILQRLYDAEKGAQVEFKSLDGNALREKFAAIVPDFDRDRVHVSDIKKLFSWYNLLTAAGYDKFVEDEPAETEEEAEEKPAE